MTLIDKAEALAPCPFCTEGKTVSTYFDHEQGDKWGYASCDACGARGPEVRTNYDRADNAPWRAEAIAAWNRRAAIPARGVGVKPLVWRDGVTTDRLLGTTVILDAPEDQAAYERNRAARILAALDMTNVQKMHIAAPAPTDAAQAREAAQADFVTLLTDAAAVAMKAREAALRDAADSLLEASVWCDSQERTSPEWHNGVADARKHHIARILALISEART